MFRRPGPLNWTLVTRFIEFDYTRRRRARKWKNSKKKKTSIRERKKEKTSKVQKSPVARRTRPMRFRGQITRERGKNIEAFVYRKQTPAITANHTRHPKPGAVVRYYPRVRPTGGRRYRTALSLCVAYNDVNYAHAFVYFIQKKK